MRMHVACALCLAALLTAGGLADAAPTLQATPNDSQPWWSRDAHTIAFQRESPGLDNGHVLFTPAIRGAEVDVIGTGSARGFRPGGDQLLVETDGETNVRDASDRQLGSIPGTDATWSPDGADVAFLNGDVLSISDAVGTNVQQLVTGITQPTADVTGPAWSPDGKQIAIATATSAGTGLEIVNSDGTGSQMVFDGSGQNVDPTWSPDGSRIAFDRNESGTWAIWVVAPDGSGAHALIWGNADNRFPQWSPTGDRLAFISDRQHVRGVATPYQYALYVQTGTGAAQKLIDDVRPDSPARWSPTGAELADAAAQECKRWGIYVVSVEPPGKAERRSNQCVINGTTGDDVIHGTPYFEVIHGFGGNDVVARRGGDDVIYGDAGNDAISAGPGNDIVYGGPGNDVLSGGIGNDVIYAGPGPDKIGCGPGNDTAYIGPGDTVRDCEHVHRSKSQ
jgi:Ca2+-binding RTX toxin-like protein